MPTAPNTPTLDEPFWSRQFTVPANAPQCGFDVVIGAIAPVFCLFIDPVVFVDFRNGLPTPNAWLAYSFIVASALHLLVWLKWRPAPGVMAGLFICASLFALAIGISVIPFTIIGLTMGIGVLGLLPFVTAFVYYRNAVRALRTARASMATLPPLSQQTRLTIACTLGVALSFAAILPARYAQYRAERAVLALRKPESFDAAVKELRRLSFLSPEIKITQDYLRTDDAGVRERLKRAFHTLQGTDLDVLIERMND